MTGNQRRSGFRLPWVADDAPDEGQPASREATTTEDAAAPGEGGAPSENGTTAAHAAPEATSSDAAEVDAGEREDDANAERDDAGVSTAAADQEPSPDFMRELVAAMRRVAEGTRDTTVADVRARADARVRLLEAEAQRRQEELRSRAEADVSGIGEWARAEAERIKAEAEQRVSARRAQLEQQLASDAARNEADAKAVRDRVNEYERELGAYYAQLAEITDPAAFAAAAKRMPRPPVFDLAVPPGDGGDAAPENGTTVPGATNGTRPSVADVHPAEEEVLAARLAELDAALPSEGGTTEASSAASGASADQQGRGDEAFETATTDVVVKGLGSFGAITSFRQVLAGVDGVDSVALSLGQGGEFVFRASHRPGFDVGAAIVELEGDAARIEPRDQGGLLVTLQRAR